MVRGAGRNCHRGGERLNSAKWTGKFSAIGSLPRRAADVTQGMGSERREMSMKQRLMRAMVLGGLMAALAGNAAPATDRPAEAVGAASTAPARDGSHDFDFEVGTWQAHVRRLVHPLTGSTEWVDYAGPSIVRPVWGGRANLGELKVAGPAGAIEGLSLRLYNPATRQWSISWANAHDGGLTQPMVGGFAQGRGEFYDQEQLDGRAIYARFIFSGMSAHSFRIEQAFSADGGKHWETNWVADFTR